MRPLINLFTDPACSTAHFKLNNKRKFLCMSSNFFLTHNNAFSKKIAEQSFCIFLGTEVEKNLIFAEIVRTKRFQKINE